MKYDEVAKRVANAVDQDNIIAAAHCATRLRLVVKDVKKIDQDALDNDPDLSVLLATFAILAMSLIVTFLFITLIISEIPTVVAIFSKKSGGCKIICKRLQ
ncbi:hypothetical protein GQS40_09090|uniref:PTS EIIB type-1 domain-containing protein n=1 Tax=Leuconostoc lactis TaxID=1246 RepID=A0A6L7ADA5_LEULA|nr:hypothetical protein [Leuconostoc lactis]